MKVLKLIVQIHRKFRIYSKRCHATHPARSVNRKGLHADVGRLVNSTRSLKPGYQTHTKAIINPHPTFMRTFASHITSRLFLVFDWVRLGSEIECRTLTQFFWFDCVRLSWVPEAFLAQFLVSSLYCDPREKLTLTLLGS